MKNYKVANQDEITAGKLKASSEENLKIMPRLSLEHGRQNPPQKNVETESL